MSDDNVPRRIGHALTKLELGLHRVTCECGRELELGPEDVARAARTRGNLYDALLDTHKAHLASMEEQGQ